MSATSPAAPQWVRFVLFIVAVAVCAVAQWNIYYRTEWYVSTIALVVAAFVAAIAAGRPQPMRAEEKPPLAVELPSWRRGLGLALVVTGGSAAAFAAYLLSYQWDAQFGTGFILLVVGTTGLSLGLAQLDAPYRKAVDRPWPRWEKIAFLAVLGLGLFLRFYRYDIYPPYDGICAIEEPQSGQGALAIRAGQRPWEFLLDRWIVVPFMIYLGDSFTSLRIPFTIVSWLSLVPFYLLLRELVSRPAALCGTALFAISRWHIIYARHAHAVFGPTLPLILVALWLCVRVYKRGGLAPYPWIGLLSAYTLYAYAGYRATTAFVGLFLGVSLLHHYREYRQAVIPSARLAIARSARVQLAGMLLFVFGFLLLVVPLYHRLTRDPAYFVEAAVRATGESRYYSGDMQAMLQQRIERVRETAAMFSHFGDGSSTFNIPGTPQLDPVSGTLLVLGLAYATVWFAYRAQGFFALYFLVILGFGTVFTHNFDIRRLQGVIPLIFILTTFFIDRFGALVWARFGRAAWVPLAALLVGLGGVAFADNYRVYFNEMMHSGVVRSAFHTQYTIAIRYLHDMPDDGYLFMISDMDNFFMPSDYEWWRGDRIPGTTSHDLWPLFAGKEGSWKDRDLHVLIQEPMYEGAELAELIERRFPEAECNPWRHPDGPTFITFVACRVPSKPDGLTFTGGARATYFRGNNPVPLLQRREPVISFGFLPDACHYPDVRHVAPCRAVWEGLWHVAEPGTYQLLATVGQGTMRLWVDGKEVEPTGNAAGESGAMQTSLTLEQGPHEVRVEAEFTSLEGAGVRLRMRPEGESRWRLLEFADVAALVRPEQAEAIAPVHLQGADKAVAPAAAQPQ